MIRSDYDEVGPWIFQDHKWMVHRDCRWFGRTVIIEESTQLAHELPFWLDIA